MSIFGRAIIREIGRNVGKGISNDLFGDWHATPVRMAGSSAAKKGYDLSYVNPEEFEVGEQPMDKGGSWSIVVVWFFVSILLITAPLAWLFGLLEMFKSKTNLYASVPKRRKDGRTKAGYRDLGGRVLVMLSSQRKLTKSERTWYIVKGVLIILTPFIVAQIYMLIYDYSFQEVLDLMTWKSILAEEAIESTTE